MSSVAVTPTECNSQDLKTCEQCGTTFQPRSSSGGSPQRFCSSKCRAACHASVGQRSPACVRLPAVIDPPTPEPTKPAVEPPSEEFNWSDDESVILREQPAGGRCFRLHRGIQHRRFPR